MTQQRTAHRRPFTEAECALWLALSKLEWQSGSLDAEFVRLLGKKSYLTEKQARRLARVAQSRGVTPTLPLR